ncbi:MAG: thiamine phosphate synthase [Parvibaculaceae bacterium]|nr:thiamine phosphate synthase [Parvibaculaceae bacterium]
MPHLPHRFYFTDERSLPLTTGAEGEARIVAQLARLPEDTGIVLRHYSLSYHQRKRLGEVIKESGRALLVAGNPQLARCLKADGLHLPQWQLHSLAGAGARLNHLPKHWILSAAVHGPSASQAANRLKANLIFASPIYTTQSHPGASALGTVRLAQLVTNAHQEVFALGGMNDQRFRQLRHTGISGYGGIQFGAT